MNRQLIVGINAGLKYQLSGRNIAELSNIRTNVGDNFRLVPRTVKAWRRRVRRTHAFAVIRWSVASFTEADHRIFHAPVAIGSF